MTIRKPPQPRPRQRPLPPVLNDPLKRPVGPTSGTVVLPAFIRQRQQG